MRPSPTRLSLASDQTDHSVSSFGASSSGFLVTAKNNLNSLSVTSQCVDNLVTAAPAPGHQRPSVVAGWCGCAPTAPSVVGSPKKRGAWSHGNRTRSSEAEAANPRPERSTVRGTRERGKAFGWPRRCKSARAFLWECGCKRLKLAQLLGRLGVFLAGGTGFGVAAALLCGHERIPDLPPPVSALKRGVPTSEPEVVLWCIMIFRWS